LNTLDIPDSWGEGRSASNNTGISGQNTKKLLLFPIINLKMEISFDECRVCHKKDTDSKIGKHYGAWQSPARLAKLFSEEVKLGRQT